VDRAAARAAPTQPVDRAAGFRHGSAAADVLERAGGERVVFRVAAAVQHAEDGRLGQRGELPHPRAQLRLGEGAVFRHGSAAQGAGERAVAEVVVAAEAGRFAQATQAVVAVAVVEARQAAEAVQVVVVHRLLLCFCLRFLGRSQGGVPHCAREPPNSA